MRYQCAELDWGRPRQIQHLLDWRHRHQPGVLRVLCNDCRLRIQELQICLLAWVVCLDCAALAQADLPTCTGILAGFPAPCMETIAVSCSGGEQIEIHAMDDNAFGDRSNTSGTNALSLIGIGHDKFNNCFIGAIGINSACPECYAMTVDYGFKSCKIACLLGWCKQSCLHCTTLAQIKFPACLAFLPDPQHFAWRPLPSLTLQMVKLQFKPWIALRSVINPTHAVPMRRV